MSRSLPRAGAVALALGCLAALPAGARAQVAHTVAPGESLSSIAAADGLTVAQLAAENGLSPTSQLIAGTTILIPPQSYAPAVGPGVAPTAASDGDGDQDGDGQAPAAPSPTAPAGASASLPGAPYIVQPGDTLWAIAARAGITVAQLAAANGLDPNGVLLAGSMIQIPSASGSQPAGQPAGAQGSSGAADAPGQSGSSVGPPYPTPVALSAGQVGSTAAGEGVPAPLAQAIGWQESGFNNDLVSPAGAVGVMQIEPATWQYVNSLLTPGAPLDPYSAIDNVRAGSLYLRQLIAQTGSVQLGVAAYYQGLSSLQRYGMLPSTRQYVRDVLGLQASYGGG